MSLNWIAGVVLVYSTLFGTGYLLFGDTGTGLICLVLAAACGGFLWWDIGRRHSATAEG